jgi:Na+(H+)/acetate symporter ActP
VVGWDRGAGDGLVLVASTPLSQRREDPLIDDPTKPEWQRRWLSPLLVLAALLGLPGGVLLGVMATTAVQRFLGWLIAAAGACNTVVAVWLLWWGRSGRGSPPRQ